jgi:hypothetical protein
LWKLGSVGGANFPVTVAPAVTHVDEQGRFTFKNMLPGQYELTICARCWRALLDPAAPGTGSVYLAGTSAGSTDVLADGFTVTPGGAPELVVRLQQGGGAIETEIPGASLQDSFRVAILRKSGSGLIATTEVVAAHSTFDSLAPGEYVLYTWPAGRELEFRNPAALSAVLSYGVPVSLRDGETQEVTLKVIPPEALP